jgi:uncharacterized protein (TIGR01777 family)
MQFAITGSSGLIGSALVRACADAGIGVTRVVRRPANAPHEIEWHPDRGEIDAAGFAGIDVIVNLAGENIFQRWTASAKRAIRDSRVRGTALLARSLASLASVDQRPRVLVSGSAIGIYGSRGDEILDEASTLGSDDDFLASVCEEWEEAARPAADAGVRVVTMRTGIVLSQDGGALAKMLLPFRLGIGGSMGGGRQWMSWIALADVVAAILFFAHAEALSGPVNLVAPNPVNNDEFTHTLAHVLGRPAILPVPRFALTALLGEMARDTVLASQRVRPRRLLEQGFEFQYPTLESALRAELAGTRKTA